MRAAIVRFVCCFIAFLGLAPTVSACYQPEAPSVTIRSTSIEGTIMLDGKPIAHAVLSLHRFEGPYSLGLWHAEPHSLARTTGADDGTFNFGEMPPGKYVILMASPSNEATIVESVRPKSGQHDRILINFSGDFCQTAKTISASGEIIGQVGYPSQYLLQVH